MTATRTTICPRCGYDLVGVIDSWTDRCPMGGTCSECGHGFEWSDIFHPERLNIPWLIEHGRIRRDWLGRGLKTLVKLTRPRRFWREVGVDSRIVLRPLILWVFALVLLSQVAEALATATGAYLEWLDRIRFLGTQGMSHTEAAVQMVVRHVFSPMVEIDYWPPWTFAGVSAGHGKGMIELILLAGFAISFPLIFMALPETRARAQLRPAHLVRAGLYGLVIVACVRVFNLFVREVIWGPAPQLLGTDQLTVWVIVLGTAWLGWWWLSAMMVGWRVQKAWLVWVLLSIASILAGPTAVVVLAYISMFIAKLAGVV